MTFEARSPRARRALATCLAAALLVPAAGATATEGAAAEPVTVRIGTVAPSGTPWSALLVRTKKRLTAESNGRLVTKLYLGGKLGSEDSLVRRCQKGQLAGIAVSNGAMGDAVPEMYASELPYLLHSHASADKALDAAEPLVREILGDKGFIFYMWGENGFRHFASKDKFFTDPSQLRGLKMRSQPAMPHVEMYRALGASASPIAVGEVTSSLANNVVTGYDNTLLYAYATQWHKEVKYVTKSAHIYQAAVVVWCKAWFDQVPADLQQILARVPDGETKKGRALVRAMNKRLVAEYGKAGVEVRELTATQRDAFKRATDGVRTKFLAETSERGRRLLQILEDNR